MVLVQLGQDMNSRHAHFVAEDAVASGPPVVDHPRQADQLVVPQAAAIEKLRDGVPVDVVGQ